MRQPPRCGIDIGIGRREIRNIGNIRSIENWSVAEMWIIGVCTRGWIIGT
jgi:hypothetical protein